MEIRIQSVVVDAHDCELLARFWSSVLGWRMTPEGDDEWLIEPPGGSPANDVAPEVLFAKVPDEKTTKNRLHFDLRPKDQSFEVDRILGLGATHADIGQSGAEPWVVLADPEGNEFCVLASLPENAG